MRAWRRLEEARAVVLLGSMRVSMLGALLGSLLVCAYGSVARAEPPPPTPAAELDWRAVFSTEAVRPCLPEGTWRALVVIAALAKNEEAHPAAAAVARALRESGRASMVIDDNPLGDLGTLGDDAIARRAAGMPFELLVIVRLGGLRGSAAGVRVSVSLRDGMQRELGGLVADWEGHVRCLAPRATDDASLSGDPGLPELTGVPGLPASRPVPAAAPSAAPSLSNQIPAALAAGLVTFLTPRPGQKPDENHPVKGLFNGTPLRAEAFYQAIERPDLAREYQRRRRLQSAILIPGLCVTGLGVLITAIGGTAGKPDAMIGGASMVFVGGTLALASIAVPRSPVSGDDAIELAEQYNRRLKQRYGIHPDTRIDAAPLSAAPRWMIAPAVGPGGAGVTAIAEF